MRTRQPKYNIDINRVVARTRQAADALDAGDSVAFIECLRSALAEHEAWATQKPVNMLYLQAPTNLQIGMIFPWGNVL